jgi:hypothetical protein
MSIDVGAKHIFFVWHEKVLAGDTENSSAVLQLGEYPRREMFCRNWPEQLGHDYRPPVVPNEPLADEPLNR